MANEVTGPGIAFTKVDVLNIGAGHAVRVVSEIYPDESGNKCVDIHCLGNQAGKYRVRVSTLTTDPAEVVPFAPLTDAEKVKILREAIGKLMDKSDTNRYSIWKDLAEAVKITDSQ